MSTKIEIITIGNELLEGRIVNTNVHYICQKLYQCGYLPQFQCSVLDQQQAITEQLKLSLLRSDVVICSGGLGPTQDDITLEVAAKMFDSDFEIHQTLLKNLQERYGQRLNEKEILPFANVPKKAELMLDQLGMAPGYIFKKGDKRLILLPGVPYEFRHLVDDKLIPYLEKNFPQPHKEYKKVIHLCLVAESRIAPLLDPLLKKYPELSVGIYPHVGILSIHFKTSQSSSKEADEILDPCIQMIQKTFPTQWFDGKFESIEDAIHFLFKEKNKTLATAESCSGGAIAHTITRLSGASLFFKGTVVSYDNQAKQNILKVESSTIKENGAVSEKCVIEMAKGTQKLFNADVAIATSGIAGPTGGSQDKPVGTVWIAVASGSKILVCKQLKLSGDRETIIQRTVNYTLAELWMNKDNI